MPLILSRGIFHASTNHEYTAEEREREREKGKRRISFRNDPFRRKELRAFRPATFTNAILNGSTMVMQRRGAWLSPLFAV